MNPISLSTPTPFHESSFSKPADLEEKILRTVENTFNFMKLEFSDSDLSDLLSHEWDLEFQQILNRGEKILATLNFKNQEDADLPNLPLSSNSALSMIPFESFPHKEGPLPSQNAFSELVTDAEKSREEKTESIEVKKNSRAAADKKYYAANREKIIAKNIAYREAYRAANEDRIKARDRAYQRAYRSKNKERLKVQRDASDKEKNKEYLAAYRKANADRIKPKKRAYDAVYRANKKKAHAALEENTQEKPLNAIVIHPNLWQG